MTPDNLLVIKTSSLGDVVHMLPAVTDIRAALPGIQIDWVVEEGFADIPALSPAVRRVIPVALRRWRKQLFRGATGRELRDFRRALRAEPYDLVLDTQGLLKSALLARLARGPRSGQDRTTAREALAALLYQHRYHVARGRHAVLRNRDLAAQALGYPLPETPPDYGLLPPQEPLPLELPKSYVVCLHGTSRDSKLWPEAHWISLTRELTARGFTPLLPWGNEEERQRAERIATEATQAEVLPQLRVRGLAAVLARARGAIGVDSGLTHLAVAFNCPTVAIYTDTSPHLTGVYPADARRAVNLGDRGRIPGVQEVSAALAQVQGAA